MNIRGTKYSFKFIHFLVFLTLGIIFSGCPTTSTEVVKENWVKKIKADLLLMNLGFFSPDYLTEKTSGLSALHAFLAESSEISTEDTSEKIESRIKESQKSLLCSQAILNQQFQRLQNIFKVISVFTAYELAIEMNYNDPIFAEFQKLGREENLFVKSVGISRLPPECELDDALNENEEIVDRQDFDNGEIAPVTSLNRLANSAPVSEQAVTPDSPKNPSKALVIMQPTTSAIEISTRLILRVFTAYKELRHEPKPRVIELLHELILLNPVLAAEQQFLAASPSLDPYTQWTALKNIWSKSYYSLLTKHYNIEPLLKQESDQMALLKNISEAQMDVVYQYLR